jgi:hypothetical protein
VIPELPLPHAIKRTEEDAAAATMRRAGARLHAPEADITLVLDVLFADAIS